MTEDIKKRPRGRPRTVDRDGVIVAAMTTWWREGVHAVSLNEICRRAEISKPALYREFGGEDGLMRAALDHYREQAIVPLLGIIADRAPFAEVLERVAVTLTSDLGLPLGCLFTRMRTTSDRLGPDTIARVRALEDERRAAFAARFQQALDLGEANPAITADLAGRYLDTQITSLLVQMANGENPEQVRAEARLAFSALLPA